ncbi:hypothetical protein BEN47_05295 [Hymenobacter lapidarius]|uniref:Uncharacterized protein n=1 Tax=Hymenobacter lapidarius TaxID=1908237 RepID=A0A1G1STV2_9BACT|nr:hypothetical protein [Hymenobacter lapidarius]OGX82033.1 hypothetical protein BEN47_05295 [Hymenobacter lapidarius]
MLSLPKHLYRFVEHHAKSGGSSQKLPPLFALPFNMTKAVHIAHWMNGADQLVISPEPADLCNP